MRGIERLRKLAEDTIEGELLWCTLENGTEASWGVTCEDDRRLSDALSEIADEIEADMRDLSPELGKLMSEITGKGYEGCGSFTDWLNKWYLPRPTYADGELVEIGDQVEGLEGEIAEYYACDSGSFLLVADGDRLYASPSVRPERKRKLDTLEQIERDALKVYYDYWECAGVGCSECPARIDGKRPDEHYGTGANCTDAKILDLLRRQRELLAKVVEE